MLKPLETQYNGVLYFIVAELQDAFFQVGLVFCLQVSLLSCRFTCRPSTGSRIYGRVGTRLLVSCRLSERSSFFLAKPSRFHGNADSIDFEGDLMGFNGSQCTSQTWQTGKSPHDTDTGHGDWSLGKSPTLNDGSSTHCYERLHSWTWMGHGTD